MKWLKNFISDIMSRATSRKFLVLLLAVDLHLKNPNGFTGDNLVWVFAAFIGFNVLENSKELIYLKLNTFGGDFYEALAIVGRIKQSPCKTIIDCFGSSFSAGGIILVSGDVRRMNKYAWFMFHEVSYAASIGKMTEQEALLEQTKIEQDKICKYMAEHTKKNYAFWKKLVGQIDYYLDAEQCLEYGIVDEIF